MLIATYNICHGSHVGGDMAVLGRDIRALGADVVGVQEVDIGTARVGGRDTLSELAAAAGMPYAAFCPAIPFEGGQYGTAVLSRLPLRDMSVTRYRAQGREARSFSRALIGDGAETFVFFNTHCEVSDPVVRHAQFAELAAAVAREKDAFLTGDFNENDFAAYAVFGLPGVNNAAARYATFYTDDLAIDNIFYTSRFIPKESGMVENRHSDHYMLYARFSE